MALLSMCGCEDGWILDIPGSVTARCCWGEKFRPIELAWTGAGRREVEIVLTRPEVRSLVKKLEKALTTQKGKKNGKYK